MFECILFAFELFDLIKTFILRITDVASIDITLFLVNLYAYGLDLDQHASRFTIADTKVVYICIIWLPKILQHTFYLLLL